MKTIHLMIGIQGSGKTTLAKKLATTYHAKIISTDEVRKNYPHIEEKMVWPTVYKMCAIELEQGLDVIFDATSITPKVRKRLVDNIIQYTSDFKIGCHFLDVPVEICKTRVIKRNQLAGELFLPIEVIDSYFEQLIPPTIDENFCFIKIYDENQNLIKEIK